MANSRAMSELAWVRKSNTAACLQRLTSPVSNSCTLYCHVLVEPGAFPSRSGGPAESDTAPAGF